ncbi:MAG TPA: SPFH domain-containing protein [Anaerolineae bacterium]|nr:SPFH domain-containing protein [Anaerolineae bacterium]HOS80759.1 SPFH domain-containing protein [Anaerolineae bacterium]HQJ11838.1 SPFH domain-containing protein [Anaerolineae bacterium]HQM15428.1 SPFH domain-containing protein [Anaerolineae bacterium]
MARIFDIIEYVDEGRQEIVNRVPERGSGDFRIGSQLIVRESQAAVFYRDGKALDTFGPGRHTLTTANIPYLVDLIGKAFSSQTPFKAEVYFVTLRELTDMKWGTPNPITIPDPILGMARVTSYGTYAMQVADPQLFVAKIVGTQGLFNTRDIEGFFRSIILTKMTDLIGEMKKSVIQMAAFVEELAAGVRAKAAEEFAARGVTLTSFYIESIAPTEETAKAIDARASMGAIGDMGAYMQYQAAQALRETAQKPGGGTAATGVELGAGLGLGAAMAQMVTQAARPPATGAPAAGGTPAVSANPTTPAEVQALLDSLDLRLANGELSEAVYQRLHDKWEQRLQDMLKTP